jgi:hypothetical protein
VQGPDGNLWFTEYFSSQVGRIDPTTGAVTEFGGFSGSNPEGITVGPDNDIWFIERFGGASGTGYVGWINPNTVGATPGTISGEVQIPTPGSEAFGITAGPDNTLWFTEFISNQIGKIDLNTIDPMTGLPAVTEFGGLSDSGPAGITVGPDHNVWFTEHDGNRIGMIDPTTGVVTDAPYQTPGAGSYWITVGPDGNLWFTEYDANQIGKVAFQIRTSVTLTASVSPSVYGQQVTFTATVSASGGGSTPGGSVDFVDTTTGTDLGSVNLTNGTASLNVSSLSVGSHTIMATYSGNTIYLASSSALSQTVNAVTSANLQQTLSPSNPVTVQVNTSSDANDGVSAVNGLSGYANTPVTVTLNLGSGVFTDVTASPPAGVTLVINGNGTTTTIVGNSPALRVSSGTVIVTGVTFTTATNAPTILVTGGTLILRNDTIQESTGFNQAAIALTGGTVDLGTTADPGHNTLIVNGAGELLHNTGANPVSAIGDTFKVNNVPLADPYTVEDRIFHVLDAGGGGLVSYVAGNVYVTNASGSVQRGVSAVPVGGTVNVQAGSYAAFTVGSKFLAVLFQNASSMALQPDVLYPGKAVLVVQGTPGNDQIVFRPDNLPGSIAVALNSLPVGSFAPTSRLIGYGLAGEDDIQVAGNIGLLAELHGGDGNDRLKGGDGNDWLFGDAGDDLLVGGGGRDLLVGGLGADRIVGNADDDIIIAGATAYDAAGAALSAIMAEWTSTRDYATRVANLQGTGTGTSFANRLNGTTYLLADLNVYDDGAADTLTGSEGLDWFFANVDFGVKDKITDLSAKEFANDLDFILAL